MTLRAALAAAVVLPVLVAGCSSSGGASIGSGGSGGSGGTGGSGASGSVSGTVTVFAAASLTEAFTSIGRQFEAAHPGATVRFNFGASSSLAQQIVQGAPADVFASASPKNMTQVAAAGAADAPKNFARNVMEIAVPPGNPAHITGVADLARSGVKVALCQPQVPCGSVAAKVFANAGVTVKPVTLEQDVKSTLTKVELKEVDAGVVYVTDVKSAGAKVTGVVIPADINASTQYPIAALTKAPNSAAARAFVDYVLGPTGQSVLTAAGFEAP